MRSFLNKARIPCYIFIICFVVFLSNLYIDYSKDLSNGRYRRMMVSGDIVPNSFLPWLITYKNTVSFDPIINTIRTFDGEKDRPYFLIDTEKGYKTAYPIFPALMGVPFYLLPSFLGKIPEATYLENILKIFLLARITASFYAALAVVLFYFVLKEVSKNSKLILIFTFFYAFGTTVWSISSRGMWQHTFSQVFFAAILLFFLRAAKKPKLLPWTGLLLGITVLIRPTNIIVVAVLSLYMFIRHKDMFKLYMLYALPTVIFLALYNYSTYGSPFIEGYAARGYGVSDTQHWSTPLTVGLTGFLFSPARSFLFLSPPLVLSFYAIYLAFKDKKFGGKNNELYKYLGIGALGTMLLMSKWVTWHGANAFGYRMVSDILPLFGLLAFEVLRKLPNRLMQLVFILVIYSTFIHFNATYFRKSRCGEAHNWSFYCLQLPKEKSKY